MENDTPTDTQTGTRDFELRSSSSKDLTQSFITVHTFHLPSPQKIYYDTGELRAFIDAIEVHIDDGLVEVALWGVAATKRGERSAKGRQVQRSLLNLGYMRNGECEPLFQDLVMDAFTTSWKVYLTATNSIGDAIDIDNFFDGESQLHSNTVGNIIDLET